MKTSEKPEKAYEKTFFRKKTLPLCLPNNSIDAIIK